MTFAGTFGVPRRHWDITFSQAPFDVQMNPAVDVILAIMALGGLLAAVGALLFIAIAVISVFFGEDVGTIQKGVAVAGIPQGLTNPPAHAADVNERSAKLHAEAKSWVGATPGTVVLVFVFLAAFILYFFVNWKMLAFVWKVG